MLGVTTRESPTTPSLKQRGTIAVEERAVAQWPNGPVGNQPEWFRLGSQKLQSK